MKVILKHSMDILRHNVRRLMNDKGWSISDLAEAIGSSRPSMSRFLSGSEGITIDRADKLAHALGFPLSSIISEKFQESHV